MTAIILHNSVEEILNTAQRIDAKAEENALPKSKRQYEPKKGDVVEDPLGKRGMVIRIEDRICTVCYDDGGTRTWNKKDSFKPVPTDKIDFISFFKE